MPGEWMMRFQIFVIIPATISDIVGIAEHSDKVLARNSAHFADLVSERPAPRRAQA